MSQIGNNDVIRNSTIRSNKSNVSANKISQFPCFFQNTKLRSKTKTGLAKWQVVRVNRTVFYMVICFSHHQWLVNGATGVAGPRVQLPVVMENRNATEPALTHPRCLEEPDAGVVVKNRENVKIKIAQVIGYCSLESCCDIPNVELIRKTTTIQAYHS